MAHPAASSRAPDALVAGVDGWSGGWVAVVLRGGRFHESLTAPAFPHLLGRLEAAVVVAVDIPIGLPAAGPRRADAAARAFLGGRSSCVFVVAPREVLEAPTHAAANRLSSARCGRGLSAQSYALAARILEVDGVARRDPRVVEVHPEVCFAALAGEPLPERKKTWAGQERRLSLLAAAGVALLDDLGPSGAVPPDDLLDAAAAAQTAARCARGKALPLPADPECDETGRLVAIWR